MTDGSISPGSRSRCTEAGGDARRDTRFPARAAARMPSMICSISVVLEHVATSPGQQRVDDVLIIDEDRAAPGLVRAGRQR